MRKIKLFLFLLCGFLLCSNIVKAEGPFILDWQTAKDTEVIRTNNIPFKDGYVVYSTSSNESSIVYYDKTGKEIKSLSLDEYVITMQDDDSNLYGLLLTTSNKVVLKKYDTKLNEVKQLTVAEGIDVPPMYIGEILSITDKIAFPSFEDDRISIVDKDLKELSSVRYSKANFKKYFPKEYPLMEFWDEVDPDSYSIPFADTKDNKYVYTSSEFTCRPPKDTAQGNNEEEDYGPECYKAYLTLLNEDYDEIWEKEMEDYQYLSEVKFIDNYIVVSAEKYDTEKSDLLIFDMKGNLVQTIKGKSFYEYIEKTPIGFIVTQTTCPSVLGKTYGPIVFNPEFPGGTIANLDQAMEIRSAKLKVAGGDFIPSDHMRCESNHQVYYLFRNIETKVTQGKGKIEVIGKQRPGEPVTFKVTPEKGYVLSKVLVTDANGKTVVFTNNVFTMPNADVTIEAIFVKESIIPINPDTGVLPTIIISIGTLTSFALLLYFNKKYQFLK